MPIELQSLSFLSGLDPDRLEKLSACCEALNFKEGHVLLRRGKYATGFYIIVSGHVAIEETTHNQESTQLQTLSGGDLLGWSWMFPFLQWHFDAIALGPVTALWFKGSRVEELFIEDPDLGRELMRRFLDTMAVRLDSLRQNIDNWYRAVPVA